jgi:hypothetical protein
LVKASFHEGIALARAFRVAGSRTDLADFSALAVCRMYEGLRGVWNGFAKNAHEGLAAPASILPLSTLLLCGQVIPMIALLTGIGSGTTRLCLAAALGLGVGFRAVLALRFRQSWWGVLMHPFSVALLLANQWYGAFCRLVGRPVGWSGRTQVLAACAAIGSVALSSGGFAAEPEKDSPKQKCPALILEDQNGVQVEIQFPRKKPCLLVVAARRGTSAIPGWVQPVRTAFGDSVEILGVADVRTVPSPLRSTVRTMIKKESAWPVLMDWSGKTVSQFFTPGLDTEVLVLNRSGAIELRLDGAVSPEREARLLESLRACGARPPKPVPGP